MDQNGSNGSGEKTFTQALTGLRQAAAEISRPSVTLEEAMELYRKGMKEAEFCSIMLDKAEQQIEVFDEGMRNDENI